MNNKKSNEMNVTFRMPKEKHLQLKKYCIDNGMTMKEFFINSVDKALKKSEKE